MDSLNIYLCARHAWKLLGDVEIEIWNQEKEKEKDLILEFYEQNLTFISFKHFLTFPACLIFSNLNSNCSNLLDNWDTSRNKLKSTVTHNCSDLLLFEYLNCSSDLKNFVNSRLIQPRISKVFLDNYNNRSEQFW